MDVLIKKGDKKYHDQLNPTQKIESEANNQNKFKIQIRDKYPHRTICYIKMKLTKNQQSQKGKIPTVKGTGCLLSKRFILTAAHNLVGKVKDMTKLTNMKTSFKDQSYIMQGLGLGQKEEEQEQEQKKRFICRLNIVKQMAHPQYIKNIEKPDISQGMDYALIQIDPKSPGFKEDKFMPIVYLSGDSINELKPQISIYGYPVKFNKQNSNNKGKSSLYMNYLCGDSNKIEKYQKKYISYNIKTQPGSSGAPIIGEFRGEHIILGIHIRGDQNHQESSRGVSAGQMLQYLNEKGYQLQRRPLVYTDKTFDLRDKDISERQILFFMDRHYQPCDVLVFTAFELKNVKKILLSGNYIGNQGVEILLRRSYPNLTGLFLTQNIISNLDKQSIRWENIKSVKTLGLNFNQLSRLPQGIKVLKNIEKFWLAHNQFKSMPDVLDQFCKQNDRESLSVYLYENKINLQLQKNRIAEYKQRKSKFRVIWSRQGQQKQLKMP